MLTISDYAARAVLAGVCDPDGRHPFVREPHAMGEDAFACDGKGAVMLEGLAARLGLAQMPADRRPVLEERLRPEGPDPLGTTTLHRLMAWSGEYRQAVCVEAEEAAIVEGEKRPALVGRYAFDRNAVAKLLHVLAIATDGPVAVSLTHHAALVGLLMAGDGWRACLIQMTPPRENMPGPETRLLVCRFDSRQGVIP